MIVGQGKMEETKYGALRESNEGRGRFDLLPYEAIEALAKWYEEGAKKYDDRNWENGISVKDCINRMIRHALKAGNGWTDEDHLAAVMWNAAAAITMMQRRPDCNDHRWVIHEETIEPLKIDIPKEQYDELMKQCHAGAAVITTKDEIYKDDRDFLVTALQCGGIEDIETLKGWVDRRYQDPSDLRR